MVNPVLILIAQYTDMSVAQGRFFLYIHTYKEQYSDSDFEVFLQSYGKLIICCNQKYYIHYYMHYCFCLQYLIVYLFTFSYIECN